MPFSNLAGNPLAKALLTSFLEQNKVPSTLLFHGPSGSEKMEFALEFAQLLVKASHPQHPDIHIYQPEGKGALHLAQTMRDLIEEAAFPPFEAPVKVFIIRCAHQMLPVSSNSLLKILEEPLPDTHFILVTSEVEMMLPTIISRCHKVPFFSLVAEKKKENWEEPLLKILKLKLPEEYSQLPALALEVEESCDVGAEESILGAGDAILKTILNWYRDQHQSDLSGQKQLPSLEHLLKSAEKSRLALQRHIKLRTLLEAFFLSAC